MQGGASVPQETGDARDSGYHRAPESRRACKDLQEQTQTSLISIPESQAFLEKTN